MERADPGAVRQSINEAYGLDDEADIYRKRAIDIIENRTGLRRLDEVLKGTRRTESA